MKLHQNEDGSSQSDSILDVLRSVPGDFLLSLAFFTRLPVPATFDHTAPMSRASQMFPAIGIVVGLIGGLVLAIATVMQLPDLASSVLAVTAMVVTTGALHEDGLADTLDGFGGGQDRIRKLEIMKDSKIGTFGVLALILSQSFRIILIASVLPLGLWKATAILIASHMVSRASSMLVWSALPPARTTGLSKSSGQPGLLPLSIAWTTTLIVVLCLVMTGLNLIAALVGSIASTVVGFVLIGLCRKQIGGQTGDTIGAAQQLCDLAFMAGVLICVGITREFL